MDQYWTKNDKRKPRYNKKFWKAVWKLSYATVKDMIDVDPHRKLVDWIPLCSSVEHELTTMLSSQPDASISKEFFNTVRISLYVSAYLLYGLLLQTYLQSAR